MSRTTKDKPEKFANRCADPARHKTGGWEYWSRRPYSNHGGGEPGGWTKRMTHRLERRIATREIQRATL